MWWIHVIIHDYHEVTVQAFHLYGFSLTGMDSAFIRSLGPGVTLRTHKYDLKWLSSPKFIKSFEASGFVYFIFRENAVEYLNCGKVCIAGNVAIDDEVIAKRDVFVATVALFWQQFSFMLSGVQWHVLLKEVWISCLSIKKRETHKTLEVNFSSLHCYDSHSLRSKNWFMFWCCSAYQVGLVGCARVTRVVLESCATTGPPSWRLNCHALSRAMCPSTTTISRTSPIYPGNRSCMGSFPQLSKYCIYKRVISKLCHNVRPFEKNVLYITIRVHTHLKFPVIPSVSSVSHANM